MCLACYSMATDMNTDRGQPRILIRFCWRRLRPAPMVLWPFSFFWRHHGYEGSYGMAECTVCGKVHVLFDLCGLVAGT